MTKTTATQQDIDIVSRLAREIARVDLYGVRAELYYDNEGNPGKVIIAGHFVDCYAQWEPARRTFDVSVKDSATGTETGKRFSSAVDAAAWAKAEIADRIAGRI